MLLKINRECGFPLFPKYQMMTNSKYAILLLSYSFLKESWYDYKSNESLSVSLYHVWWRLAFQDLWIKMAMWK